MKWHRFLIYFALWASAVVQAATGARLLTGAIYGDQSTAQQVYAYFQGVKTIDQIFGVLSLAMAAYLIYTRFQLAGMKEGAPGKLLLAYGGNLVLNVGYLVALSASTGIALTDIADGSITSSIISSLIMILANRVYYQKRAHLFGRTDGGSTGRSVYDGSSGGTSDRGFSGGSAGSGYSTAPAGDSRVTVQTRYCTHCGKKAEPGDVFCTSCGQKLD